MADSIDENLVSGLRRTEIELEELALKLNPPEPMPEDSPTPASPLDSDAAKDAAAALTELLGERLRSFVFAERPPRTPGTRRRSRFTSPSPPAAVATPPPTTAAVPAPVTVAAPVERPAPIPRAEPPTTSGTPNSEFGDHLEDHHLNLNESPGPRGPKAMRGPIIGGFVPPE